MKLNLGCGQIKLDGYLNVDLYGEPDLRCDLRVFPWPWADGEIEAIYSRGCYEHLPEFNRSMRESWRVLRPGGTITIIVPHYDSPLEPWPEQHLHRFSLHTFRYLLPLGLPYVGEFRFRTVSLRLVYGPRMKFLEPVANILPSVWEWAHLPMAEIEWVGIKRGAA